MLESVLFYGATQLGLWLVRPEAAENVDAEMDDNEGGSAGPGRGRLNDRVRRGMVGEMASELRGAIEKARGVLMKSREGDKAEVDVAEVLLRFLTERVIR